VFTSFHQIRAEEKHRRNYLPCSHFFLEEELMSIQIPSLSNQYGFVNDPGGAHSSRTMMLADLRLLLAACPQSANLEEYRSAIVDENVLLKKTVATRKASFKWMREIYGIDRKIILFRALRDLWDEDIQAQSLLALLIAVARDPI